MTKKRYTLLKKDGKARRGEFVTPHGTIQTPVFMNVGTLAAIKGAVSSMDLLETSSTWQCRRRIIAFAYSNSELMRSIEA